jgi:DNA-binding beta-propeller fold protein YncE
MLFNKVFLRVFILCFFILSCKKKNIEKNEQFSSIAEGYLLLNEGLFNQNNASLTWYDVKTRNVTLDVFQTNNQRGLGDTGNDMIRYGNKIYIVVNVSSIIEVLDVKTLKSVKQIPMIAGNKSKQPRNIIGYGSNVFVSCFDGYVDVIDTVSFQITKRIKAGNNPENLCLLNQKLLVANSGGLNPPKMDSTISIVDLNTLSEIKKITVGINPGNIIKGLNGNVYVISRGNYNDVEPRWKLVNIISGKIEKIFNENIIAMELYQDSLLLINTNNQSLSLFSMKKNSIKLNEFISLSGFVNPYNIQFLPKKNEICITDANGYVNQGFVSLFDSNGKLKEKFKAGINPSKVISYE